MLHFERTLDLRDGLQLDLQGGLQLDLQGGLQLDLQGGLQLDLQGGLKLDLQGGLLDRSNLHFGGLSIAGAATSQLGKQHLEEERHHSALRAAIFEIRSTSD